MTSLHTVLAATDLSAPSRHAVARAALIARDCDTRLELLHVIQPHMLDQLRLLAGVEAETALPRLQEEARHRLTQIAREFCATQGIDPGIHLATGPVVQEIASQANALDADLLVLGARGMGFMHHLLLGSTAERMLRKTVRPLLIVKQFPHESYRRILIPVDFSKYALRAIRLAQTLAPKAELMLLHVFSTELEGILRYAGVDEARLHRYHMEARQQTLHELRKLAEKAGLAPEGCQKIALHGHPSTRILEQEEESNADLIIIGKHGKGMVEELLLGSTTKHVLAGSRGDVLVAR